MSNMAFLGDTSKLFLAFFSLILMLPVVEALDAGDAVALLLGIVLTIIGFCACLGFYARKRNGQL
ncbi:small integral membrane protein 30 [Pelodiscus sinensis]|uniref:small integral membrane protein 30 n=1 Tax=Pelodiscus sinensis TaxID=13735 RepID=UPI000D71F3C3|nr:small integral membrane protein 30 [Pelodiscus sinensis]|eukprot:XP_025040168.1 small integral membrane protein 30 [Pelodiscus sinensis]